MTTKDPVKNNLDPSGSSVAYNEAVDRAGDIITFASFTTAEAQNFLTAATINFTFTNAAGLFYIKATFSNGHIIRALLHWDGVVSVSVIAGTGGPPTATTSTADKLAFLINASGELGVNNRYLSATTAPTITKFSVQRLSANILD